MTKMFKCGLLVLTSPLARLENCMPALLSQVNTYVQETLYVHLVPESQHSNTRFEGAHQAGKGQLPVSLTDDVRRFVTGFYGSAANLCNHIDVRVLLSNIGTETTQGAPYPHVLSEGFHVILSDLQPTLQSNLRAYITQQFSPEKLRELSERENHVKSVDLYNLGIKSDNESSDGPSEEKLVKLTPCETYNNICLGGTFDELHAGHKILLSEATMRCNNYLVCGVTSTAMNKKKTLAELLTPAAFRQAQVEKYLRDIKPSLRYDLYEIDDPFGPSIWPKYADLQCCVVSQETKKGGDAINSTREKKDLPTLDIVVVDLVEDKHRSPEEEVKISSSSQRKRKLGTLLNTPVKNPHISGKPYVLGLTGGIASGKSSVCKKLQKQGAAIVDCDKLGHKAYLKGSATFAKVIEAFGEDIIGEDGEINRRALGAKVFSDKAELNKLNQIVWPSIAELAKAEIKQHAAAGYDVVVLDAAVLLEAEWNRFVHEVWVAVIPRDEAIKRIMDRNGLSEEEAVKRIDSQLSNQERVERANVVLSTLWEIDVTQKQVEKAWGLLQDRIK